MDHLFLNDIAFPVERGVLYRGREELGDYRWGVEVYCGESPQLDFRNWPDDRVETPDDFLAGTAVMLGAQRLPLRVGSPDELVGREYLCPPSPEPDPSEWQAADPCWPYFFLYVWEGHPTEQLRVAFTATRGRQYRVEIAGGYTDGGVLYSLRVQAWLDWQGADAAPGTSRGVSREGGQRLLGVMGGQSACGPLPSACQALALPCVRRCLVPALALPHFLNLSALLAPPQPSSARSPAPAHAAPTVSPDAS